MGLPPLEQLRRVLLQRERRSLPRAWFGVTCCSGLLQGLLGLVCLKVDLRRSICPSLYVWVVSRACMSFVLQVLKISVSLSVCVEVLTL